MACLAFLRQKGHHRVRVLVVQHVAPGSFHEHRVRRHAISLPPEKPTFRMWRALLNALGELLEVVRRENQPVPLARAHHRMPQLVAFRLHAAFR